MRRVGVGMEKADSQRLDALIHQLSDGGMDGRFIESGFHRAVELHPLRHFAAKLARHQRFREFKAEIEQLVACLARHIEHIAEALAHHHAGARTAALDDRVGHQRGAMGDRFKFGDGDVLARQKMFAAFQHRARRIVRRGQLLMDEHFAARLVE